MLHYQRFKNINGQEETKNLFSKFPKEMVSFDEFATTAVLKEILNPMVAMGGSTQANSFANILYHVYAFWKSGEKVFRVEEDLALMLYNTEAKGMTADMIKTPYYQQYIVVPPGLEKIKDPISGEHDLEGVYVCIHPTEDPKVRHFMMLSCGLPKKTALSEQDDTFSFFRVFLNDEQEIMPQVLTQLNNPPPDSAIKRAPDYASVNNDKIPRLALFIMNVLLYITSPDRDLYWESWADIDSKVKKLSGRERQRRIDDLKQKHHLAGVLGGTLKLKREVRELYRGVQASGRSPITVRTLVMGHYRKVWYGAFGSPKRAQRPKWIEPFWRGVGNDPISNKEHLIV